MMMTKRAEQTRAGSRLAALAMAVMLASAAAYASSSDQDRAPAPSRQPVPDSSSVSPAARKSYENFWKRLPKSKADALERELNALEARQRRGEAVERDLDKLHRDYSQLFVMSASLHSARWIVSSGGGTQGATCTGLGWIGRNGRLRCLGRMTTWVLP
jgi:hypothetical protein